MTHFALGTLSLARGGHLALRRALLSRHEGEELVVTGDDAEFAVHAAAWARKWGVNYRKISDCEVVLTCGQPLNGRWTGATRAGIASSPSENPARSWGLAGRSAAIEAGTPEFDFPLAERDELWTDDAGRLYAAAAAAQWDPAVAIPWDSPFELPPEIEDAVVQLMTYLVENETAALVVPARFCTLIHPHFREIVQVLAIQTADEARHIEVFTRRALLKRPEMGLSTAGGQASLKTLVDEHDFSLATFLLSVLGEGSFLALLRFLDRFAPDPVTRSVARLAAQDEARHVAFGLAHLERHAALDPGLLPRLANAVESRHAALQHTAGLNEEVFDALVLISAGNWTPKALEAGWDSVVELQREMDAGRQVRLRRIGFSESEATRLSSLHTRNFM